MTERRVRVIERKLAYDGYFKIIRYSLAHGTFAGGETPPLAREIFERGHAVAVLPYDPERDEVVLIEQFRPGALGVEADPWLIEIVAGIVEPGEAVEEVARREAREEAGLDLADLQPVARYFVSPGGSTETVQLFIARIAAAGAGGLFGLAAEGEDIKVHVLPFEQAVAWLAEGRIKMATTIIALQWLQLHRERLRRAWLAGRERA
ncbi:MAG: NUDIX domain-containing protein [Alphaproteobacteria bacterium]